MEEIVEMLRILDDEQPAELSIEGDGKSCVIRLILEKTLASKEEYIGRLSDFNGVTDKIRFLSAADRRYKDTQHVCVFITAPGRYRLPDARNCLLGFAPSVFRTEGEMSHQLT